MDEFIQNHRPLDQPETLIEYGQLKNIFKNLTNGKRAGFSGVTYEMFKYTHAFNKEFITSICKLFSVMLTHGIIPYLFNISIMVPLVKDSKKDLDDPNNLRPISISNSISNIFETVILAELGKYCNDGIKQFGFKSGSSCNHAAFCLTELIKYADRNNLTLYVASLDASKAFDKIDRNILWSIILDLPLPKQFTFILIKFYDVCMAFVECNGILSTMFLTILGVKQGGVVSPRLFALYICELISIVDDSKIGAALGKILLNIMLYADDIILVSYARACLQRLLDLVSDFGIRREIKFNPDKSLVMVFEKNPNKTATEIVKNNPFKMNSVIIPLETSMRYLGMFYDESGHKLHLQIKRDTASRRLADLSRIGIYSHEINPLMKAQIYQTMVRPILLYGCELNTYNIGEIKQLESLETMMIKEIIGIHKKCHNGDLIPALKLRNTKDTIKLYKYKFLLRLLDHQMTAKVIPNIISSLPKPRANFVFNLSFLEEIFRLLKIPYSYDTKKYIWNIKSLISRAKEEICKIETNFELNKNRPYVIQLREKFNLPYNRMINAINHDLLAIDPYQEEQEIDLNTLFDNELIIS